MRITGDKFMYRARFVKWGVVMLALMLGARGIVGAQDKTAIEFDQWVSGEISDDVPAIKYGFSGKTGQLITVVMMADPDENALDTALELRTSDGDVLAQNDDVLDHYSMVIVKLPADGDYTIVAMRYQGADGSTTGKYQIEVSEPKLITQGTKMSVDITSESDKRYPHFYVLQPMDSSGSIKVGFNVESNGQYPQLGLFKWKENDYPDILFYGEYLSSIGNLSFNADLDANDFYVLMVDPVPVFYNTDFTAKFAFSIN